jgi:hypothetical protein
MDVHVISRGIILGSEMGSKLLLYFLRIFAFSLNLISLNKNSTSQPLVPVRRTFLTATRNLLVNHSPIINKWGTLSNNYVAVMFPWIGGS